MRPPDSGLATDSRYDQLVSRITINPTSIDPLRPSTTINSSSFTLIDKGHEVTKLFANQKGYRMGQEVRIWIGRSFEGMDFSDYLELPKTYIKSFQKTESNYNFSTVEAKDRIEKGIFNIKTKLAVNIVTVTTVITLQSIPSGLPSSGYVKINDEFIGYAGISGLNLTGCTRGEFSSIPANHEGGSDVFNVINITSRNGLDLLSQILISGGGGGPYDVLSEGLGFSASLVDTDQIEEFRDEFFVNFNLSLKIWGIESVNKFLEAEVFGPMGVRLRTNQNGKIGIAVLNRNIFEIDAPVINNNNNTKQPSFTISEDKIINRVRVNYNWNDGLKIYEDFYEETDATSIAEYGETPFTELSYKGVKTAFFAESIAALFLARFSHPRPEITVITQDDAANLEVGDKTELVSDLIPTEEGTLDFISNLEVIKKTYNITDRTVNYALSFTSFSGLRQCFISPSDLVISHSSQKIITISAGRGAHYRVGWKMRHYDNNTSDYADAQVNEIASIVGDVITFVDDWLTTLVNSASRIVFADYDDVTEQQKKFCFVNDDNLNFNDGSVPYEVTYT